MYIIWTRHFLLFQLGENSTSITDMNIILLGVLWSSLSAGGVAGAATGGLFRAYMNNVLLDGSQKRIPDLSVAI